MKTIKDFVYTRQDLEKSRQQACKVLEELEGKRLTPFGQLRQDNAKRTIEIANGTNPWLGAKW